MQLSEALERFEYYLLTERRVANNTVLAYTRDIAQLIAFAAAHNIHETQQVSHETIKSFLSHLKLSVRKNVSMARKVASLRAFHQFLQERYQIILTTQQLRTPKLERPLPKALSFEEVQELLMLLSQQESLQGQRDYALIALLYATGMRVSELTQLQVGALEHQGVVKLFGKGSKERLVPLSEAMQEVIKQYMQIVRTALLQQQPCELLFFGFDRKKKPRPLTRQMVWAIVHRAGEVLRARGKKVSPHVFRHSLATHLLHNGMDLRSLQLLLGHEQVTTVQIYTKVETSYLRRVYDAVHKRS